MLGAFQPGQKSLPANVLNKMRSLGQATSVGIPGAGGRTHTLVTPQGTVEIPPYPKVRVAKITGAIDFGQSGSYSGSSCTGFGYAWVPQRTAACGGWEDADDVSFQSGSDEYMTAFEANGDTSVAVGTIVLLWEGFNNLTTSREWIFWAGEGDSYAVVRILGSVGFDLQSGCASEPDVRQCPLRITFGITQKYDPSCDIWRDGRCVFAADLKGRNLLVGQRYIGHRVDSLPHNLQAIAIPYDSPCKTGDYDFGKTSFYVTEISNPAVTILIQEEIGVLCSRSGSSGNTATQTLFSDDADLTLYNAVIQTWNPETCLYDVADAQIYAAELHGCLLDIGIHYEAHYETVVPNYSSGSHTETCVALYLVDHVRETPRGVADVTVGFNGDLNIWVWQPAGRCGEVSKVLSHTIASCCQSGGGSGGSGGPGPPLCCDGRDIGPMYATAPGVGTCAMTFTTFPDATTWWVCHMTVPSCGKTLWLRWFNCAAQYSCDGTHWAALGFALGEHDTCGPPFVSRKWDGANLDSAGAGCDADPPCGTINGIIFSE